MPKPWEPKWKTAEHLGSGAQGRTYRVHRVEGTDVTEGAAKELMRATSQKAWARLKREAEALSRLDHSGIPKILDSNLNEEPHEGTTPFLISEYIAGSTLRDAAKANWPSALTSVRLVEALLDALEHAHAANCIHRDIKPTNIMLRDDDFSAPVLIDFGLVHLSDQEDAELTNPSEQIGNRFFLLPELKYGVEKGDPRSDFTYCAGVLIWLLTRDSPIVLLDGRGLKPHQRTVARQAFSELSQDSVRALTGLFDRAFETNIEERWQEGPDLRIVLRAVRERLTDPGPPPELVAAVKSASAEFANKEEILTYFEGLRESVLNTTIEPSLSPFFDLEVKVIDWLQESYNSAAIGDSDVVKWIQKNFLSSYFKTVTDREGSVKGYKIGPNVAIVGLHVTAAPNSDALPRLEFDSCFLFSRKEVMAATRTMLMKEVEWDNYVIDESTDWSIDRLRLKPELNPERLARAIFRHVNKALSLEIEKLIGTTDGS